MSALFVLGNNNKRSDCSCCVEKANTLNLPQDVCLHIPGTLNDI